jgi:Ni,Fe-hydrogenase I cytochrome b subunit
MGKNILKYGLISGGVMTGLFIIAHLLFMKDFDEKMWSIGEVFGYTSMVLSLAAIFFGIKAYRDKVLNGKIAFGKAFLLGLGISVVASLIFGLYTFFLYNVIQPDLSSKMIDIYREKIRTSGETQEIITQKLAEFETEAVQWSNPVAQVLLMIFTVLPLGILISLVSAAILKRKELKPV